MDEILECIKQSGVPSVESLRQRALGHAQRKLQLYQQSEATARARLDHYIAALDWDLGLVRQRLESMRRAVQIVQHRHDLKIEVQSAPTLAYLRGVCAALVAEVARLERELTRAGVTRDFFHRDGQPWEAKPARTALYVLRDLLHRCV